MALRAMMDAELDRLLTLCEVSYYNHLRAMSLLEEGKVSEHFVSGCDAGRRMARENLHDYIQRTYGVPAVEAPVAWVPIHPRNGPLWSMTTDKPDAERLPASYPLRPLVFADGVPASQTNQGGDDGR